jgi:hypothetical protein
MKTILLPTVTALAAVLAGCATPADRHDTRVDRRYDRVDDRSNRVDSRQYKPL